MLDELRVGNLGLIAEAHIEPGPGLVVVTGETGAGKTLLLGALRLLLGQPARKDQIGPVAESLHVEGRFLLGGDETVAARRVDGDRSRAYLDGSMVPAKALAETTAGLVEMVGQHDHLALATTKGLYRLVDAALDADGRDALEAYRRAFSTVGDLIDAQAALGGDRRALERELDITTFQAEEISGAGFEPGDDVGLAAQADRLRNAETITELIATASGALDDDRGAVALTSQAVAQLDRLARLDPEQAELAMQGHEVLAAIDQLRADVSAAASKVDRDPAHLAEVEERIALLGALRRKYGESLEEVLRFGEAAAARAYELSTLLERADGLADEIAKAEAVLAEAGSRLLHCRRRAAAILERNAVAHLRELGFQSPVVDIRVETAAATRRGADTVDLRFSSDTGLTPGPVSRVASGGELSRLVLALRLAAGVAEAGVVAFDEIDAGVGGSTALALGKKLAALAEGRQVLCVTHLPQVAAFADAHFVVSRDGSTTTVRNVEADERLEELARMLSGLPDSDRGREHAAELVALAQQGR